MAREKKVKVDKKGKAIIEALQSFEEAKGLSVDIVCRSLEEALVNAYQKQTDKDALARASVNPNTGEILLFNQKEVVEEVFDDLLQISLEEAREELPLIQIGDMYEIPVEIDDFVRASAMHVKTVLKQKIREAEKEVIYNEYIHQKDDIIVGNVEKVQEKFVIVNLGKVMAIMPSNQCIPGEVIRSGDNIKVYIVDVTKDSKGSPVLVSRNNPNFLKRLMEKEISEIYNGEVEIRSIAREAGDRAKVAVSSRNPNIDATGACIGAKGVRIQSISQQLCNEKIDVILYDERPEFFVAEALKPARVRGIVLDEENHSMIAVVPDEDYSLAIGKKGQNARLAVKLTGWKIDIKTTNNILASGINYLTMSEIERKYSSEVVENHSIEEIEEVTLPSKEEETINEEVKEEVKPETVKTKIKATSIYETSTFAYKGSSELEERTTLEEKAQEIVSQVKVEEVAPSKPKEEVKKVEEKKVEDKNYMPIYSKEELEALEDEEFEDDEYDYNDKYDEYDDDDYYN